VRSPLLVLCISRSAETSLASSNAVKRSGHRLIKANGCEQACILLRNDLSPDLVILDSSVLSSAGDLGGVVDSASDASILLVCDSGETRLKSHAVALGLNLFLQPPVITSDICAVLKQVSNLEGTASEEGESRLEGAGAGPSLTTPVLEELTEGRFFLALSPSMLRIYRQVQLLADVDAPVLILGESGTGKEIIAHLIHKHSRRSEQRFVNVNCAALPADLLESELFGYRQGAFTGAIKDKPGKFELANRGTLLLDEIGEMSAQMQAKLLHVLQDGQINRLGACESSRVDVRVLAATNVHIESALLGKSFREDLYYRLNVFTITVPSLRERREEIPFLIEEIVRRFPLKSRDQYGFIFSSRLIEAACLYDWRGNIRELRNFVTRTLTMRDADAAVHELESKIAAGYRVEADEQMPARTSPGEHSGMRAVVREMKDRAEAEMIKDALEVSGWNRRHAAEYLNISYRGLLYKIQQHRISPRRAGVTSRSAGR
jgi:two-component system, NtrC family, response regulator AtoC